MGSCPLCLALFRKETNPVPILHITFCLRSCTKFSRIISVHMQTAELWCQKLDQLRVFSTKKLGGRHFSTRVSVHLCEIQDSDKAIYTLTLHRQSQLSKISQKNLHFSTKTWRICKWKELKAMACFSSSLSPQNVSVLRLQWIAAEHSGPAV